MATNEFIHHIVLRELYGYVNESLYQQVRFQNNNYGLLLYSVICYYIKQWL